MEGKQLTETILRNMKKKSVIYAELVDRNAIGQPGIAKIYTLVGGKLNYHFLDVNNVKNEAKNALFDKFFEVLMAMSKDGLMIFEKAGFGNYAWKRVETHFVRNDKNHSFTFKEKGKSFEIETSNAGLYQAVAPKFADRDLDYPTLVKHRAKIVQKFKTNDELALYNMYAEAVRLSDAGLPAREFTVDDYWITIKYLRWKNFEDFNLSEEDRISGIEDVARYRLLFASNQVGWQKIDEIFTKFVKSNKVNLLEVLNEYLFEPIENSFAKVDYTNANLDDPFGNGKGSIVQYCMYPLLLNILPKVNLDIIEKITKMTEDELSDNAVPLEYFLANFILGEERFPYTIILPAVFHIVEKMPSDGEPRKHLDFLFWLASDIINSAWKSLEETDEAQSKFRDQVYKIYYGRFGSTWPIIHYGEFKFNSDTQQNIYNHALGWLMSVTDIDARNSKIRDYFDLVIKDDLYPNKFIFNRALAVALREYKPEEKLERIIKIYKPTALPDVLSYPENVDEAKCLLDELFNPNGSMTGMVRIRMFEQLLINPNSIGVGEFILNYINDHFDKFIELLATDAVNENISSDEVVTSIITAIAKGITEENEFTPYKAIVKKALDININGKILEAAMKYARKHRQDILFQRSALQKIF